MYNSKINFRIILFTVIYFIKLIIIISYVLNIIYHIGGQFTGFIIYLDFISAIKNITYSFKRFIVLKNK